MYPEVIMALSSIGAIFFICLIGLSRMCCDACKKEDTLINNEELIDKENIV